MATGFESALDPFTVLRDNRPAPPPAQIRPFSLTKDLKVARYLVGASVMEPSSLANLNTLWSPIVLCPDGAPTTSHCPFSITPSLTLVLAATFCDTSVWAAFTHFLVHRIGPGWPTSIRLLLGGEGFVAAWNSLPFLQGAIEWLTIIPLVVTPPIVLLAAFELRHRTRFEDEMTRAIGEEDMRDVQGYYATDDLTVEDSATPVSTEGGRKGFWVLEYDGRIIGAVGLDGRKPGKTLNSIVDLPQIDPKDSKKAEPAAPEAFTPSANDSPYPLRNRKAKPTTPSPQNTISSSSSPPFTNQHGSLQLRRFATSASFRPAHIEDDLLQFVATFAFTPSSVNTTLPPAKRITIALRPTVEKTLLARLKKNGFKPVAAGDVDELRPDEWKETACVAPGITTTMSSFLDKVWPLDLNWKTYALDRDDWAEGQIALK
ncbi:hypothetical protein P7C70_g2719, partial [Phenoliferia sp. Uapishka_3]